MATETMTLTEALSVVRRLTAQIQEDVDTALLVGVVKGTARKPIDPSYKTAEEQAQRIQSDYQSITDRIKRRSAIKNAITKANFSATVELFGQQMTIMEAIEVKNTLPLQNHLLAQMERQLTINSATVTRELQAMEAQIERVVSQSLQAGQKASQELYETLGGPIKTNFEATLNDPLDIKARISELKSKLREVEEQLDFRLGTVNSTTTITVEY